jgi:hypothetical protein
MIWLSSRGQPSLETITLAVPLALCEPLGFGVSVAATDGLTGTALVDTL